MGARVSFLVDGFNLYHSLREAESSIGRPLRWLDIRAMCMAQLSSIASVIGRCDVESVYYFSAFAHHVDVFRPGTVRRHETYVEALADSGVCVEMAQFKQRERRCPRCGSRISTFEEKVLIEAVTVSGWPCAWPSVPQ